MNPPETWEMIAIGAVVLVVLFLVRPGLKQAFQRSKDATKKDWAGLILPIGLVILFVILLISLA